MRKTSQTVWQPRRPYLEFDTKNQVIWCSWCKEDDKGKLVKFDIDTTTCKKESALQHEGSALHKKMVRRKNATTKPLSQSVVGKSLLRLKQTYYSHVVLKFMNALVILKVGKPYN